MDICTCYVVDLKRQLDAVPDKMSQEKKSPEIETSGLACTSVVWNVLVSSKKQVLLRTCFGNMFCMFDNRGICQTIFIQIIRYKFHMVQWYKIYTH